MSVLDHDAGSTLLKPLQVPAGFAQTPLDSEDDITARLAEWKHAAQKVLGEVQALLQATEEDLPLPVKSELIFAVAPFECQEPWTTPISRETGRTILSQFQNPDRSLLRELLVQKFKPLFRSNPHPSLNVATGRRLARPAGGSMATQDFYEEQGWKGNLGVASVLLWVIKHMKSEFYEDLWHLIIPPVMTLLDDYEARYKLDGVRAVSCMLGNVPASLLKRTGVDGLIRSSLKMALTHIQAPESKQLIEVAAPTSATLTLLTTKPGSAERFNELCDLLGEGIISNVWTHSFDKPDVIYATFNAIPPIIESLGVSSSRYIKALMIQLFHALRPEALDLKNSRLQLSALRVLAILITECAPCLPRWKTAIINVVAKLWVTLSDTRNVNAGANELRLELRRVCIVLEAHCLAVRTDDYKKLLLTDPGMFGELLEETQ